MIFWQRFSEVLEHSRVIGVGTEAWHLLSDELTISLPPHDKDIATASTKALAADANCVALPIPLHHDRNPTGLGLPIIIEGRDESAVIVPAS